MSDAVKAADTVPIVMVVPPPSPNTEGLTLHQNTLRVCLCVTHMLMSSAYNYSVIKSCSLHCVRASTQPWQSRHMVCMCVCWGALV